MSDLYWRQNAEIAFMQTVLDNKAGGNAHAIRLEYPGVGRYRAVCACGQYRSKAFAYLGLADGAGQHHVAAKGGA